MNIPTGALSAGEGLGNKALLGHVDLCYVPRTDPRSEVTHDGVRSDHYRCRSVRTICGRALAYGEGLGGACVRQAHVILGVPHAGWHAAPLQLDCDAHRRPKLCV